MMVQKDMNWLVNTLFGLRESKGKEGGILRDINSFVWNLETNFGGKEFEGIKSL